MTVGDFDRFERELSLYRLAGVLSVIGSLRISGNALIWDVTSNDKDLLEKMMALAGCGGMFEKHVAGRRVMYTWTMRNQVASTFLTTMLHYFDKETAIRYTDKLNEWTELLKALAVARQRREARRAAARSNVVEATVATFDIKPYTTINTSNATVYST